MSTFKTIRNIVLIVSLIALACGAVSFGMNIMMIFVILFGLAILISPILLLCLVFKEKIQERQMVKKMVEDAKKDKPKRDKQQSESS